MYSIDFTSELLPTHTMKFDWRRKYGDLSPNDRLQLLNFYEILRKRSAVVSLAGLEKIDEHSSGAGRKFMSCRRK